MILFSILLVGVFWAPLRALVDFSIRNESSSHILLIPFVSLFLIVMDRKSVFANVDTGFALGITLVLVGGLGCWFVGHFTSLSQNDYLAATILPLVVLWTGGFILCYGTPSFRAGMFPVLFLLLLIPIPSAVLSKAILFLQKGSTEVAYDFFKASGVPVYRDGFMLSLPGVSIEVAQECSGIRSSIALFITSLLAGQLYLRAAWRKALLCSTVIPLVLIKNGARIATLTLLALHVDRSFLLGRLHQEGGVVFFVLALGIQAPVLWLLRRLEESRQDSKNLKLFR
jgi:exosortase